MIAIPLSVPVPEVKKASPVRAAKPLRAVDPVALFNEWVHFLPEPLHAEAADPRGKSSGWYAGFQSYIDHILRAVYPNAEIRALATTEPMLDIWRRAFTDPSFAADDYDTFETIGDKALGYAFVKYVYSRRADVTPMVMSNFMAVYMSKQYQARMATELKMDKWILFGKKSAENRDAAATASVREDVFEAFAASLDAVGTAIHLQMIKEKRYREAVEDAPTGADCVRRLVDTFFDGRGGLDEKYARTAAKTLLFEIATIFGLGTRYGIEVKGPRAGKGGSYSFILPDRLAEAMEAAGIKKLPRVLSSGFDDEMSAANAAYDKLAAAGADFKWIRERQEISRIKEYIGEDLYEQMHDISVEMGYPKLFFDIPKASVQKDGTATVILKGADANDNIVVLGSDIGKNIRETKLSIAIAFISEHSKQKL
jgi:dsRNA-specific ribonuclease